ncbi:hypothetical protein [Nonomuraea bangladeshensis]|uniref:hypothetical protein n=1 Tax=Nonomuraea bangladeshensis TaxID=404385 RepID=UPI0031CFB8E8
MAQVTSRVKEVPWPVREGQVSEATLIYDEQRISVSTLDGQKWYARYGPPDLSHEALSEELGKADPRGNVKVTVRFPSMA